MTTRKQNDINEKLKMCHLPMFLRSARKAESVPFCYTRRLTGLTAGCLDASQRQEGVKKGYPSPSAKKDNKPIQTIPLRNDQRS